MNSPASGGRPVQYVIAGILVTFAFVSMMAVGVVWALGGRYSSTAGWVMLATVVVDFVVALGFMR